MGWDDDAIMVDLMGVWWMSGINNGWRIFGLG